MRSVEELVLAVPRDALVSVGLKNGVTLGEASGPAMGSILNHGDFLPRSQVERDASLLQPIPCAVIKAGATFLTLRRGEGKKDSPLHGRYVIWVGGHVRLQDSIDGSAEGNDFLIQSLFREVEEELSINASAFDFLGLIAPPGALHFAILYESTISPTLIPDVSPNREFLTPKARSKQARFLSMRSLVELYPRLDIWSKLALKEIYRYSKRQPFNPQLDLWRTLDRR